MSIDAIGLVREHGVVLECAKGPVPNLAEAVAGNPIRGNCWNHPDDKQIVRATRLVRDSEQVLECRLAGGKLGAPVGWGRVLFGWPSDSGKKHRLRFAKNIPPRARIELRSPHSRHAAMACKT